MELDPKGAVHLIKSKKLFIAEKSAPATRDRIDLSYSIYVRFTEYAKDKSRIAPKILSR